MKYRLLPYIYTYAREAYETGLPIMRPMFMEYPADLDNSLYGCTKKKINDPTIQFTKRQLGVSWEYNT